MSSRAETVQEMAEEAERLFGGKAESVRSEPFIVKVRVMGTLVPFAVEEFSLLRSGVGERTAYAWKLKQERRTDPPRIVVRLKEGGIDSAMSAVTHWLETDFL